MRHSAGSVNTADLRRSVRALRRSEKQGRRPAPVTCDGITSVTSDTTMTHPVRLHRMTE
jgi:hypothetical protein